MAPGVAQPRDPGKPGRQGGRGECLQACLEAAWLTTTQHSIESLSSLALPCHVSHLQIATAVQTIFIGFILAWLYSDMSMSSPDGIQNETG